MAAILPPHGLSDQRPFPETRPHMLKADLRKAEQDGGREAIGRAIGRAVSICGWSLKEFAREIQRDERQCARWLDGKERPQLDTLFAVPGLRHPLIQALSELADADVEVVIRLNRRSA